MSTSVVSSQKKRKRDGDKAEKSRKRQSLDAPVNAAKITYHVIKDGLGPIIASSAGMSVPHNVEFVPYQKSNKESRPQVLLHSSSHSRLDYVAQEEDITAGEGLLRHYIGIYDPQSSSLQIVEAPKVTVRSTLRPTQRQLDDEQKREAAQAYGALRETLANEFGTKKAKKAIADKTLNAISTVEKGADGSPIKNDALTRAVLDSMASSAAAIPTREMQQSTVDDAKPRPKPHLEVQTTPEIYPLHELIPNKIMSALSVKDWQDARANRESIEVTSRFVAKTIGGLDSSNDESKFKILRFAYALLEFFNGCKALKRGGRKVPVKDDLMEKMKGAGVTDAVVNHIRMTFSEKGELSKWQVDRILTHICALSLHIDNFEVDTYTLKEDMRLDRAQIKAYFRELGCKVNDPTEKQKINYGLSRAEASQHQIARLTLPPDFPKQRVPAKKTKR